MDNSYDSVDPEPVYTCFRCGELIPCPGDSKSYSCDVYGRTYHNGCFAEAIEDGDISQSDDPNWEPPEPTDSIQPDESPSYRDAMRDAGRGGQLR